jgi:hypothetical protein
MTPTEVLQEELRIYEKALKLSKEKFAQGIIDKDLHEKHVCKLEPKIQEFKNAVRVLTIYS